MRSIACRPRCGKVERQAHRGAWRLPALLPGMATRMATRASRAQAVVDAPKSKPKAASRTRHQQRELDRADQQPPDIHAQKSAASLEADSNTFVVGEPDDRYTSHTAETYVNNIVTKLPSQRRSAGLEDLDTIPAFYAARTQPTVHVATPGVSHSLTQSATALLSYLATGTTLTMLSSHIGDQNLADSSVQVLALTKFSAMLAFTSTLQLLSSTPAYQSSKRCTVLMSLLGVLDVVGYATYCLGLELCGAAVCTLINAAAQQLFTALLSRTLLGKRFTHLQHSSLVLVVGGLILRSVASGQVSLPSASSPGLGVEDSNQVYGACLTLASALTYSILNLLYDYTVQTTEQPPPHPVIMGQMARIGLLANGIYTIAFTVPHWDKLVSQHLEHSQGGATGALLLLLAFGALYNLHGIVQGRAFRMEGALGIALMNSMRGSTVAVVCSMLYCSTNPGQCLTVGSSMSALMITIGGILWVVHGASPKGALARELKRLESKNVV